MSACRGEKSHRSSDEVKGSKLRSFLSCLNIQSDYTRFNLSHLQTGITAPAANQVCPEGFVVVVAVDRKC